MPVVELSYSRLQKLVGKVTKKQISDSLPFLGLDIEYEDKDLVRIEYSPNRPDYSTDFGIALGLQGLLGKKTGAVKLKIKKSNKYKIYVKPQVSKIRPFVTGIIAKNGTIDDKTIKQLMTMQE
ncbi:MAG: phenylalanine--tRNA ligase subunit beta, partial [Nitrosopumilus sp.]|nr:phenylalanine--tRNA ligase subunit beta [Nitrosopumilus sp.]